MPDKPIQLVVLVLLTNFDHSAAKAFFEICLRGPSMLSVLHDPQSDSSLSSSFLICFILDCQVNEPGVAYHVRADPSANR